MDLDLFDMRRRVWGQRVVEKWPVRYREALEPDHDWRNRTSPVRGRTESDLPMLSVPVVHRGSLVRRIPEPNPVAPVDQ
ncbi:hypothetical protein [Microbispora bryophytorum]|uniref:hypothetical protein n=1 Tax=Microbispora bryophytorum TaxID=1460882 RepID=UPI00340CB11D